MRENPLQRFIDSVGNACIPRKEYTMPQVIHKLEKEIYLLHQWLLDNEPDTGLWRLKRSEMLRKIENLEQIKSES